MTFRPRMTAQTRFYRTLQPLKMRSWAGVVADVWRVRGEKGGGGFYVSPDPRLVVFLGEPPRHLALSTAETAPGHSGLTAFYVPAGTPLWSSMSESADFAHLDLHLQAGPLAQRMAGLLPRDALNEVRFLGQSDLLASLSGLIADEVIAPRRPTLMLDGLVTALLTEVFSLPPDDLALHSGGLAPWQMAALADHLQRNLTRRISVAELAEVVGLSESWFAHAFRKANGDTPQRWQLGRRVEAARDLIAQGDLSLAEVAQASGFADQAHLTRAFRSAFGVPPSQWRKQHMLQGRIAQDGSNQDGLAQERIEFPT